MEFVWNTRSLSHRLSHRLCQADISEREAQNIFAESKEPWSAEELMDRHELCYDVQTIFRDCYRCGSRSDLVYEPHFVLDLALPTCCRQIYHEAHSLTYSANIWSFTIPLNYKALRVGTSSALVGALSFSLHRLHLDIMVDGWWVENSWNYSFRYISRAFRCLRHFYVDIDQRPHDTSTLMSWYFQKPADCTFLKGLLVLRNLKLRSVTVTVADNHILHCIKGNVRNEDPRQYRWSLVQKQEWAAYVTRLLLRQEDCKEQRARLDHEASDTYALNYYHMDTMARSSRRAQRFSKVAIGNLSFGGNRKGSPSGT